MKTEPAYTWYRNWTNWTELSGKETTIRGIDFIDGSFLLSAVQFIDNYL